MNLSNEQIKKILDEAPSNSTDWCMNIGGGATDEYGFNGYCKMGYQFADGKWNKIPLSDLRKQLDGERVDGLPPIGVECWFNFKVTHPQKCTPKYIGSDIVVYTNDKGREYSLLLSEVSFSKIETEAEKVERERLESAYDLFVLFKESNDITGYPSFAKWQANQPTHSWLAIVDKTKYRKEVE